MSIDVSGMYHCMDQKNIIMVKPNPHGRLLPLFVAIRVTP